jgi:hypothetical protein
VGIINLSRETRGKDEKYQRKEIKNQGLKDVEGEEEVKVKKVEEKEETEKEK